VTDPSPDIARGPVREIPFDAACPVCGHEPLTLRSLDLELPYFGGAVQTTLLCGACGYRHGDLMLTRHREPQRITLRIERPDHRSARVARSSSGTVRIPELGAAMEPGPRAEAFVTNVEGVVRKFLDVVQGQEVGAESAPERATLAAVHARIEGMIEGREAFTFVLEDPTGNSDVFHGDAVREPLSAAEAARLKSSEAFVDLADLASSDEEE
jgi:zinc finger protein ZPR1